MTDYTESAACGYVEGYLVDDDAVFFIGENDIFEADISLHLFKVNGMLAFLYVGYGVADFKEALESVQALRPPV